MRLIWSGKRALVHAFVAVAIACGTSDGGSGETEGATDGMPTSTAGMTTMSGGQTTAPTSDATSTSDPSTGATADDSDSSGGSSGEPATSSEGSGSISGGESESSSTGEPVTETDTETTGAIMSQACADGCLVEVECGPQWTSAEECTDWCNGNLGAAAAFSPFCMQAWEQLSACKATLDCDQYAQWQAPVQFPYPCSDQDSALAFECEGQ